MSAGTPEVRVERKGPVAILTLDHPASRNGLSPAMRDALSAGWARLCAESDVKAVVLTGAGATFSAGSDIGAMLDQEIEERVARLGAFHALLGSMVTGPLPLVVAVEGAVAGGSLSLLLVADWVVAATDAIFVPGWLRLAVAPDAGFLWHLRRLVGPRRTLEWVVSNRRIGAEEAERWGLITEMCPPGTALEVAVERATAMAAQPPAALAATRRLLAAAPDMDFAEFLLAEQREMAALFSGAEHRDAVAAFLDAQRRRREERG